MTAPLLAVRDLSVDFRTSTGSARVVDGLSFDLEHGDSLGLVGESGCGKTMTALALMGLLADTSARVGGSIRLEGRELIGASERSLRALRGSAVSMVFQEPMTALNPVITVGRQLVDVLRRHTDLDRRAARARAAALLEKVGIADAAVRMRDHPHELSGGMRQRVLIAMSLACSPRLLIADEPTSSLDVTTQARVLTELRERTSELGTALILISHDLGVVARLCRQIGVMYCGRIVEQAPTDRLLRQPRHRYSEGLLATTPRILGERIERLPSIPGSVPEPGQWPPGCRFAPRCRHAEDDCRRTQPELREFGAQRAACLHPAGEEA